MNPKLRTFLVHTGLFLLAVLTTLMAGAELAEGKIWFTWGLLPPDADPEKYVFKWYDLGKGWLYSASFLTFLTFHEFGHYFTAVYYRLKVTLPYYIPFYIPIPGMINIGSMGAVIRLKQTPVTTRQFFDIGIAGPLAGFVVSLALLVYGFTHLPPLEETVLTLHPEYLKIFGGVPNEAEMQAYLVAEKNQTWAVGSSLLFDFLARVLPPDPSQVPPRFEMMHYPLIFVGYLTLFFTALNLLPIGQLDGGHVTYGLFGRKIASNISRAAVVVLGIVGTTGFVTLQPLTWENYTAVLFVLLFWVYVFHRLLGAERWIWVAGISAGIVAGQLAFQFFAGPVQPNLLWVLYAFLVVRVIGVNHPPALVEMPIGPVRTVLGWVAIAIFILCFTPQPIVVVGL
jgi:membrane-associated protease RseP (regulator of RpoE activity)